MPDKTLNTILYIDDDKNLRALVKMSLKVIGGYSLKLSASGTEALEVLKDFSPDIILLDLMMPEMNGMEVLKKIKMQITFKKTPIILMTGQSEFTPFELSKELTIIGIINKPFNPIRLSEQIQTFWNEYDN